MALSALASGFTVLKLRIRWTAIDISCARFLYFIFFVYIWLWCASRTVYYIWVCTLPRDKVVDLEVNDPLSYDQLDRLGIHAILHVRELRHGWIAVLICIGDAAIFAVALVTFPLVYELFRIATHAMDRGKTKERVQVGWYFWIIHGILAVFVVTETVLAIVFNGYTNYTHACLLLAYFIQAASLLYMAWLLATLKLRGREQEAIHGELVQSPIYMRLKRMLFVYVFFTFQFQVSSIIFYATDHQNSTLIVYLGVSLLMFNATGLALSIITSCSQSCILELCRCCVPSDLEAQLIALSTDEDPISDPPPQENPIFVVTDIESSSALWAIGNGRTMQLATEIHDSILRSMLLKYRGYEITTCGDSFHLAFHTIHEAVEYCLDVQLELLVANWPKQLHNAIASTKKQRAGRRLIFHGLRVRMGIHDAAASEGELVCDPHIITGKMTYTGASEVIANEVGDIGNGGQILVTQRIADWLLLHEDLVTIRFALEHITEYTIPQVNAHLELFQVIPLLLKARLAHFEPPRLHLGTMSASAAFGNAASNGTIACLLQWRRDAAGLRALSEVRVEECDDQSIPVGLVPPEEERKPEYYSSLETPR